jgi:hypothetical protein
MPSIRVRPGFRGRVFVQFAARRLDPMWKVIVAQGFGGRIVDTMKEKGVRSAVEFEGSAKDAAAKAPDP